MGHKIVEAIIEDGQIKHVEGKLPEGKIRVHLIYDTEEEPVNGKELARILKETAGIYKEIDAREEARKLRESWKGLQIATDFIRELSLQQNFQISISAVQIR